MYEEWKDLLYGAKIGEVTLKEGILERLRPLIISSIKSYYNRRELYEELIQEGELCILECIENFKDDKNVYFLGYVKTQLKYLYLNKNKIRVHSSLNVSIGEEKQEELLNMIASDEKGALELMTDEETIKELHGALPYLSDRQREVIILFYVNRKSISQIAEDLGVKYRTVVNTKTRALEILRQRLEEKD